MPIFVFRSVLLIADPLPNRRLDMADSQRGPKKLEEGE
jgi:hypothetical protein